MAKAYRWFKESAAPDRYVNALAELEECAASDWRKASIEWIKRRYEKWQRSQQQ